MDHKLYDQPTTRSIIIIFYIQFKMDSTNWISEPTPIDLLFVGLYWLFVVNHNKNKQDNPTNNNNRAATPTAVFY